MNLFLDIETTGVPEKGYNWAVDYKNYPYVVSIAWDIRNKTKDFIIHQEGRKIPKAASDVHGITTKMANDPGIAFPASFVFNELMMDAKDASNIIGHNIYFDVSIIKANVLRLYGPESPEATRIEEGLHKDKRIDTMRNSQKLFGKWPKLSDLFFHLFKEKFNAHSAKDDMLACKRCYKELVRLKII